MSQRKQKRHAARKFTQIIGEFKALAELNEDNTDWSNETIELRDHLAFKWNTFCFDHGYYRAGSSFAIECKVMLGCIKNEGSEQDLRDKYSNELKLSKL